MPRPFSSVMYLVGREPVLSFRPFFFHSIIMALFASIIGPFGGFFASGLKRGLKIKVKLFVGERMIGNTTYDPNCQLFDRFFSVSKNSSVLP